MKVFEISNGSTLSFALFTNVTNSKELLDSMQSGTMDPECALLNASLVPDIFPVLAAAHKTLLSKSRGSLTTRTLHSELVYNYSGSKHITESLKRCGISESSSYILAARFNTSPEEMEAIRTMIKGDEIELEELEAKADKAQIQKIKNPLSSAETVKGVENGFTDLEMANITRYQAWNLEYLRFLMQSHVGLLLGMPTDKVESLQDGLVKKVMDIEDDI